MSQPLILITGGHGQLGSELQALLKLHPEFRFAATDKEDLSIDDEAAVEAWFAANKPAYCINAAAYTAVDKAETDTELAYLINATATGILAAACKKHGTRFVHVSTDYVFDGTSSEPYTEEHPTDPINAYGASKERGEELCMQENEESIIIRTAWVYSSYGNNFVKTMQRLMKERDSLNVVSDQIGAPTYAADLAAAIVHIISKGLWVAGIYHYSNQGRISWYDFAVAIRDQSGLQCDVHPISSSQYPTPAKRPAFSLLNTAKIRSTFGIEIPEWQHSLQRCIDQLNLNR
ncbi:dTDP-4-dehydrorhamnose reductase [Pseudoflavitalea sp. G-6-1-2]|uniref:dTDP-4-dehydrorhamnose reductase n=1 Tax=Pseudoflavitalea sp. G-6-1-2 TaxID=2728841 RepID=UPI00146AC819|nr:dTDP-4-dehydrorhamnose reductase [Pseudoflavitalea sp. G-6-1-2]NML22847.1 dTDP-4-dehydrorhamnose reductase [Pseudoflavitalea sp. G-6-1-2]